MRKKPQRFRFFLYSKLYYIYIIKQILLKKIGFKFGLLITDYDSETYITVFITYVVVNTVIYPPEQLTVATGHLGNWIKNIFLWL